MSGHRKRDGLYLRPPSAEPIGKSPANNGCQEITVSK
jgi:hypothetical protein